MKLATLIKSTTAALLLSASLASAQIPAAYANDPVIQQIAAQLTAQGFEITNIKTTLLGRYKIDAVAAGFEREIVVSAGAGTVLRDDWNSTDNGMGTDSIDAAGIETLNGVDGSKGNDGSNDNGTNDNGSNDNGSNDNGSNDNGSNDNGANDNGGNDSNDGPETPGNN